MVHLGFFGGGGVVWWSRGGNRVVHGHLDGHQVFMKMFITNDLQELIQGSPIACVIQEITVDDHNVLFWL